MQIYLNQYECIDYKKRNKYIYNGYITDTCPDKFISEINNICKQCFYLNQNCVLDCLSYFLNNDLRECYSCKDKNKMQYEQTCRDNCPFIKQDKLFTIAVP